MGLGRRLRSTDKTHSSDSKNRSHKYTKKVTQIYKKKTFRTLPSQQSQCFPQWLSSIHVLQPGVKNIIIRVEKRKQWQTTLSEETVGFYQLWSSNVSESCVTSLCLWTSGAGSVWSLNFILLTLWAKGLTWYNLMYNIRCKRSLPVLNTLRLYEIQESNLLKNFLWNLKIWQNKS